MTVKWLCWQWTSVSVCNEMSHIDMFNKKDVSPIYTVAYNI